MSASAEDRAAGTVGPGLRRLAPVRAAAVPVVLLVALLAGCSGGPAPEPGPAAADEAIEVEGDRHPTTAQLRRAGPTNTPFDRGPRLRSGEWLPDLLAEVLMPVIREEGLDPETRALYWVLVDSGGEIEDAVLHTDSGNARFDRAARVIALNLRYRPARRDGEEVPVWVLARISLLMR